MKFEIACSSTSVQFWSDVRLPSNRRARRSALGTNSALLGEGVRGAGVVRPLADNNTRRVALRASTSISRRLRVLRRRAGRPHSHPRPDGVPRSELGGRTGWNRAPPVDDLRSSTRYSQRCRSTAAWIQRGPSPSGHSRGGQFPEVLACVRSSAFRGFAESSAGTDNVQRCSGQSPFLIAHARDEPRRTVRRRRSDARPVGHSQRVHTTCWWLQHLYVHRADVPADPPADAPGVLQPAPPFFANSVWEFFKAR